MSLTNLAFGGPTRTVLYCTESTTGTILRTQLDVPGMTAHTGRVARSPGA
jgi:gluconolactonase